MKKMYLLTYIVFGDETLKDFQYKYKLYKNFDTATNEMGEKWDKLHDSLKSKFGFDETQITNLLDKWCYLTPVDVEE